MKPINEVETDIPDIEESDLSEMQKPEETFQWRKYLWALKKKNEELNRIVETRDAIVDQYNSAIEAKRQKIDAFKEMLKSWLLVSDKFKTKTSGFKVEIPDIGKFTATAETPKFQASDTFLKDEAFFVQPEPVFSKKLFNDFVKSKIQSNEYVINGNSIVDTKTGEIVHGVSVSSERAWSFPKG